MLQTYIRTRWKVL